MGRERWTFGASTGVILALLAGQFVKWIILANVLAWPAASANPAENMRYE